MNSYKDVIDRKQANVLITVVDIYLKSIFIRTMVTVT